MDTEEQKAIQQAIRDGRPETDEGPYYHDSWWESYKGSVKGKFGGAIIGTLVGAVIGAAVVAVISFVAPAALAAGGIAAVVASFAGAGLLYGQEEFSNVGTVTGAVAAAQGKAEERMKSFENGKFAEMKQEIGELKEMVGGKKSAATTPTISRAAAVAKNEELLDYRTSHSDKHGLPKGKFVFWKVAAIGLIAGAAAGAVLAASGIAAPILATLGLGSTGVMAASMATFGLFGASFGINRDMFRKVFDNTDLLFRGITRGSEAPAPHVVAKAAEMEAAKEKEANTFPVSTTISYENHIDHPISHTHHRQNFRERLAAERSLLSFDHTRATPQ